MKSKEILINYFSRTTNIDFAIGIPTGSPLINVDS